MNQKRKRRYGFERMGDNYWLNSTADWLWPVVVKRDEERGLKPNVVTW
jgi:hypothetical protein